PTKRTRDTEHDQRKSRTLRASLDITLLRRVSSTPSVSGPARAFSRTPLALRMHSVPNPPQQDRGLGRRSDKGRLISQPWRRQWLLSDGALSLGWWFSRRGWWPVAATR